jgi:hypothetical protein
MKNRVRLLQYGLRSGELLYAVGFVIGNCQSRSPTIIVNLMNFERNLPFRQEKLEEDMGSHKVQQVHEVHIQDRLATFQHFPVSALANRSNEGKA